ncbi:MAG: C-terminal target protein [Ignavibacteria bacterium]|nr:C-terminal target protein [Ignavibacteria bacterium]
MKKFLIIVFFIFGGFDTIAQSIVVSEYFNSNTTPPSGEWTELLVIEDNISIEGYALRDNNSQLSGWIGGIVFKGSFWRHLRAGTIIVIEHRGYEAVSVDKNSGFIRIGAENSEYFEKKCWSCNNINSDWSNFAMSISKVADIVEIIDSNGNHIHSLSHTPTAIGDYLAIQNSGLPNVNHSANIQSFQSVKVVPGRNILAYRSGSGTGETDASGVMVTKGNPNISPVYLNENQFLWRTLRQPSWNNPGLSANIKTKSIELSWNKITDPFPDDSVQGYMIVRIHTGQIQSANPPIDGIMYNAGDYFDDGEVVASLQSTNTTNYIDNFELKCGDDFTYRIFAFRYYGTDANPASAHGRSFNEVNFTSCRIFKEKPKEPVLSNVSGKLKFCNGESAEIRIDSAVGSRYVYELYCNSNMVIRTFQRTLFVKNQGSYQLIVVDTSNGCESYSQAVNIEFIPKPDKQIYVEGKKISVDTVIRICKGDSINLIASQADSYEWFMDNKKIQNTSASIFVAKEGNYLVQTSNGNLCYDTSFSVILKYIDLNFKTSADSLYFAAKPGEIDIEKQFYLINDSFDTMLIEESQVSQFFSLKSPSVPVFIKPKDSIPFKIIFSNTTTGKYSGTLIIKTQCGISKEIKLYAEKSEDIIGATPINFNFGLIPACMGNTGNISITFTNKSSVVIKLFQPKVNPPYHVISGGFPLNLSPGKNLEVSVETSSQQEGIFIDTLKATFQIFDSLISDIEIPIQCEFAKPKLNYEREVDVGEINECEEIGYKDNEVTNIGKIPVTLIDMKYDARLNYSNLPLTLLPGESKYLKLSVKPDTDGKFTYTSKLIIQPCSDTISIELIGKKSGIVFSISKDTIDFGNVIFCNKSYVVLDSFFISFSGTPQQQPSIKDLKISEPFTTDLKEWQNLLFNNKIKISLSDCQDSSYTGELDMVLSPCDISKKIILKANKKSFSYYINNQVLNFGRILAPGQASDTIQLKNTGSSEINIFDIVSLSSPFKCKNIFPIRIKPGSTEFLIISFDGSNEYYDSIFASIIITEPCQQSIGLTLIARADDFRNNFAYAILPDTIKIMPGNNFEIPVIIEPGRNFSFTKYIINRAEIRLRMHQSIFQIDSMNNAGIVSKTLDNITLSTNLTSDGNFISKIYCTAYIGDRNETEIAFDTIDFHSEIPVSFELRNGVIRLDSVCFLKNRILKTIRKAVSMQLLEGELFSDDFYLNVSILNNEFLTIRVFDINGFIIERVFSGELNVGKHDFTIKTSNYSSGLYFILLQSKQGTEYRKFILQK